MFLNTTGEWIYCNTLSDMLDHYNSGYATRAVYTTVAPGWYYVYYELQYGETVLVFRSALERLADANAVLREQPRLTNAQKWYMLNQQLNSPHN